MPTRAQTLRRTRDLAALGRKMFFDTSLSGSGKLSCASCHDPAFAYGPPNGLAVQPGGRRLELRGIRAAPSLRYLQALPHFTEHYFDPGTTGDDSIDNGPTGGLTWDGRVDRGRDQAREPLLSPFEMANENETSVVAAALKASYARELVRLAGSNAATGAVFNIILDAFEAWEQDPGEFDPYSSKYDAWLAGRAALSDAESRGLELFTDANKGNCARCHIATRSSTGAPPQFTDYALIAIGVPRNREIPANSDRKWHDLGMCGPLRLDFQSRTDYCGRFMTPSLRNVATRNAFFHNGVFHSLREVIEFYVERDTNPRKSYSTSKFDDLPRIYWSNIDMGPPFGGPMGGSPALNGQEIDDVIAFLKTLTDGFRMQPQPQRGSRGE